MNSTTTETPGDSADDSAGPRDLRYARELVEGIDRRYSKVSLSTAPVLDLAAELLQAWWTTAAGHGITPPSYQQTEWARSLANVALDMAAKQDAGTGPHTPDEAVALLNAVADNLRLRGIRTSRDVLYVALPRTSATPNWGTHHPERLAITIDIDAGWQLVVDQPNGSYVVRIVGRCDNAGIDAMLDLATAANTGAFGNIFTR